MAIRDGKELTAETRIRELVRHSYWVEDINCAKATLRVLAALRGFALQPQVLDAAAGMHGAGLYRAQCGLVEGALMFLGVFLAAEGAPDAEITRACNAYAAAFEAGFGSLRCFDLRPGGFRDDDPPHACEQLSLRTMKFAHEFILERPWALAGKVPAAYEGTGRPQPAESCDYLTDISSGVIKSQ